MKLTNLFSPWHQLSHVVMSTVLLLLVEDGRSLAFILPRAGAHRWVFRHSSNFTLLSNWLVFWRRRELNCLPVLCTRFVVLSLHLCLLLPPLLGMCHLLSLSLVSSYWVSKSQLRTHSMKFPWPHFDLLDWLRFPFSVLPCCTGHCCLQCAMITPYYKDLPLSLGSPCLQDRHIALTHDMVVESINGLSPFSPSPTFFHSGHHHSFSLILHCLWLVSH